MQSYEKFPNNVLHILEKSPNYTLIGVIFYVFGLIKGSSTLRSGGTGATDRGICGSTAAETPGRCYRDQGKPKRTRHSRKREREQRPGVYAAALPQRPRAAATATRANRNEPGIHERGSESRGAGCMRQHSRRDPGQLHTRPPSGQTVIRAKKKFLPLQELQ